MEAGMDRLAAAEFRFLLSKTLPQWMISHMLPDLPFGTLTTGVIYEHLHQLWLARPRPRLQEEDCGWVCATRRENRNSMLGLGQPTQPHGLACALDHSLAWCRRQPTQPPGCGYS